MEPTLPIFSLAGKNILITGASGGIGRAVSQLCSKLNASLFLTGRDENRLNETLTTLSAGKHIAFPCDLTDIRSVANMVSFLPEINGVVHCAGIGHRQLCRFLTSEEIDEVMAINFKSPVMLQTELLKQKRISKGASIVFVASIASWSPSIGNSIYSASKGALVSYANCLSLELAPKKVRVNCISPAMVWTDLITSSGLNLEDLKLDEQSYPLKRYGKPEDIAGLAAYLLSDVSCWMTGSNVKISGGAN